MQEIFDLIVFEHIVMIDDYGYDENPINNQLPADRQLELNSRLSHYKGESKFFNQGDNKSQFDAN
jgi:hypothetical protein